MKLLKLEMGKTDGSGRKKVVVSCLFKDIPKKGDGKVPRVQCTFCSKHLSKNGTRMKQHIATCQRCPITVKEKYNLGSETTEQKARGEIRSSSVTPTSRPSSSRSKSSSVTMSSSISHSPSSQRLDLHLIKTPEPNKDPKPSRISMHSFLDRMSMADQVNIYAKIRPILKN